MMVKRIFLLLMLAGVQPGLAIAQANPDIEYLLHAVSDSGCQFDRNGEVHDATEASAHMRKKYDYASRWISGPEDFIERIGTGSSISGKPYYVICDGQRELSRDWLANAPI